MNRGTSLPGLSDKEFTVSVLVLQRCKTMMTGRELTFFSCITMILIRSSVIFHFYIRTVRSWICAIRYTVIPSVSNLSETFFPQPCLQTTGRSENFFTYAISSDDVMNFCFRMNMIESVEMFHTSLFHCLFERYSTKAMLCCQPMEISTMLR